MRILVLLMFLSCSNKSEYSDCIQITDKNTVMIICTKKNNDLSKKEK